MAHEQSKKIFIQIANEGGYTGFKDIASIVYDYLEYDEKEFIEMVESMTKYTYIMFKTVLKINYEQLSKIIYDILYKNIGIDYIKMFENISKMIINPKLDHYIHYVDYHVANPIPEPQNILMNYDLIIDELLENINITEFDKKSHNILTCIIQTSLSMFFYKIFTKRNII